MMNNLIATYQNEYNKIEVYKPNKTFEVLLYQKYDSLNNPFELCERITIKSNKQLEQKIPKLLEPTSWQLKLK